MQIDSWTTAQRDGLIKAATGTIKVTVPSDARGLNFVLLKKTTVKVNKVDLVEGRDWTAATSAAATASSLASAITAATATTLCTAAVSPADASLVVITANTPGFAGNQIALSCFQPDYTFPSGATLSGGAAPQAGNLIYNSTTSKLEVLTIQSAVTQDGEPDPRAITATWQAVVTA